MYRRPDRNLAARNIALIATLLLASGCVQATRHSNTMVFGSPSNVVSDPRKAFREYWESKAAGAED